MKFLLAKLSCFLLFCLLLASCSLLQSETRLSINFAGARAIDSASDNNFRAVGQAAPFVFDVFFDDKMVAKGVIGSFSEKIAVGRKIKVTVNARANGVVVGTGSETVITKAGENNVYITLRELPVNGSNSQVTTNDVAEVDGKTYDDFMTAFNAVTSGQTFKLLKDFQLSGMLQVSKNMTFDLNGKTFSSDGTHRHFEVLKNVTFTLTSTIAGGKLTGGYASDKGGAVFVNGGTFIMEAGEISGNTVTVSGAQEGGGGVAIFAGGKFEMRGGDIKNNSVTDNTNTGNGGGILLKEGTFEKTGGSVSGNTAQNGSQLYVINGQTATVNGQSTSTTNNDF